MTFNLTDFLKNLTTEPGVYRMFDAVGTVIYVGKAKNLKKRVSSYFNRPAMEIKTQKLVSQIASIEVTVAPTEVEALLLENTLIKQHQPRYNILFKDDKTYPYLYLSAGDFPRISGMRGTRKLPGDYFGPYPSMGAIRDTLNTLHKTFTLRQCNDSFFASRSRPCLQYQIKRCSAPCVGYISKEEYQRDVQRVKWFLQGKDRDVLQQLGQQMQQYSDDLEFEAAARVRDQIQQLQQLQQQQITDTQYDIDADVIALAQQGAVFCVQVLFVRHGRIFGNKVFFPTVLEPETSAEVLSAFIPQFYTSTMATQAAPQEIIIDQPYEADPSLQTYLEQQGVAPEWKHEVRGIRRKWLDLATLNVQQALHSHLAQQQKLAQQFQQLTQALHLPQVPERIECFDISHTQGESTVASCVVFDHRGAVKTAYRRFNITGITGGDDYAAMAQALSRHIQRLIKSEKSMPGLILIDGGKGQLSAAQSVLTELSIDTITLVGVAKGPARKAGMEQLWRVGHEVPLSLPHDSPALHLIQQIRDEAHRFAITGHRKQRQKKRVQSVLEQIPGIGKQRRQAILQHFGGWQTLQHATIEELEKVPGVSKRLAQEIERWIKEKR
jgi:excinuclease ABC subunit C